MKYILMAFLFLSACSNGSSSSSQAISPNSSVATTTEETPVDHTKAISATWYFVDDSSADFDIAGHMFTFQENGAFEATTYTGLDGVYKGYKSSGLFSYDGTTLKLKYKFPPCASGQSESLQANISENLLTIESQGYHGQMKFGKGSVFDFFNFGKKSTSADCGPLLSGVASTPKSKTVVKSAMKNKRLPANTKDKK